MSRPRLVRLDRLLVDRGLAPSRQRARELIEEGRVQVNGLVASKASTQVRADQPVLVTSGERIWVGRGARKLLGALEDLPMTVEGCVAADLGASTGGFTEVLLEHGASRVYAVDVGRGQLHNRLASDPRVVVMDGVNVRHLEALPEPVDRIVGDLSFISLALILPSVWRLLSPGGQAVLLVKPQFEAGRSGVGARGRVKADAREAAIDGVRDEAVSLGFVVRGSADCRVAGAKSGNVEHFLWLERPVATGDSIV